MYKEFGLCLQDEKKNYECTCPFCYSALIRSQEDLNAMCKKIHSIFGTLFESNRISFKANSNNTHILKNHGESTQF